jgi:hypothetical protein
MTDSQKLEKIQYPKKYLNTITIARTRVISKKQFDGPKKQENMKQHSHSLFHKMSFT